MTTSSARSQPPIDTTVVTDTCVLCGGNLKQLEGYLRLRQCMSCGDLNIGRPSLVIAGPDLVAVVKAMAEFWERLREIDDTADLADDPDFTNHPDDPTFAELYENQAQALARLIDELRIGGDE